MTKIPALALGTALALAGCADAGPQAAPEHTPADRPAPATRTTAEAAGPEPRLAVTYDGGVLVLDAEQLQPLADFPLTGFTRLNEVGDGRQLLVSEGQTFRLLDLGSWTRAHGDHGHSYATDPLLTDVTVPAGEPGHVVHHGGKTVLWDDATGKFAVADTGDFGENAVPVMREHSAEAVHHGVAIALSDDSILRTVGTEEERTGAVVLRPDGTEIARTDQCPGVHGETLAADEVVVLGCSDGLIYYRDGQFHKVQAPDAYGRIGNQAGSEDSPIVLGDYKTDKDAEVERTTRVTLTDTRSGDLGILDVGSPYWFRSLGRGPSGEGLVLTNDGALKVIDPEKASVEASIPVITPWQEKKDWQEPGPAMKVIGSTAYITDAEAQEIVAVDLEHRTVSKRAALPQTPNELNGVTG